MAYEIRQTTTTSATPGVGPSNTQFSTSASSNVNKNSVPRSADHSGGYNQWATSSRIAHGYYDTQANQFVNARNLGANNLGTNGSYAYGNAPKFRGTWPTHDLFAPSSHGGNKSALVPMGANGAAGTSIGYLQREIPPCEVVPGASGIPADRATAETADVYSSEQRPAVVYERRIRKENEEIQDVVDRNRYTTEIRQIIQPVKHVVNLDEKEESNQLVPIERGVSYDASADNFERYERQRKLYPSGALIPEGESTEKVTVRKEPVIRERIRARVIEEIQPVVYREVIQPVHVKSEQPIHETVIHGATVREVTKADIISFEEFERRGYRLEGRERSEKLNHPCF